MKLTLYISKHFENNGLENRDIFGGKCALILPGCLPL